MKKLAYVVAALVGVAMVTPTIASAQSVVIRTGHPHMRHHHHHHSYWRHHHHHHRHHRGDVVVIKKHRY